MPTPFLTYVYDMETGKSLPWVMPQDMYQRMLGRAVRPGQTGDSSFEEHVERLDRELKAQARVK